MDHITVNDLHSVLKSAYEKHHSTESASRLVCRAQRCHISLLMRYLHYLPIRQCIHFKILLFTFNPISGIAPLYIEDLDLLKSQACVQLEESCSRLH